MSERDKEENNKEYIFPEDKIVLLDGRELKCFPLANEKQNKIDENNIEIDTTGRFLTIGKIPSPKKEPETAETLYNKKLFIENVHILYNNRKRILNDSRMFLCPVAIENSIAYTGTSGFRNPTLGVYIEWWNTCKGSVCVNKDGVCSIVYHISGSPLSGTNGCSAIREDGVSEKVNLQPFSEHWVSFTKINKRYSEAKARYEAYTLQQVLDKLREDR